MKKTPVKLGGAFALAMAMLLSLVLALPAVGNSDLLNGYGGYQIPDPSIDIEKYVSVDDQVTWHDADTPPGPEASAGSETVWFKFIATNNGDVALTNVTLSDTDFDAAIASQCTVPSLLSPGESFECMVGPFVAIEGQHINTATATGDYDSLTYTDTDNAKYFGTIPEPRTGDITAHKFNDLNGNGMLDAGEPGLSGWEISLYAGSDCVGTALASSVTDGNGNVSFINLSAGDYSVKETLQTGWQNTTDLCQNVTLAASDSEIINIGNQEQDVVNPAIEITKTADPTEVSEPGGLVQFIVRVDNTSTVDSVTIDTLNDSIHGDLNGQGDCACPQTIPASGYYECSFSSTVSGNAGYVETDVVTASGYDDDSNPVSDDDDATVTITDTPSGIEVTKTVDPTEVSEPGEPVQFNVRVENTSAVDSVTIDSLSDSIYGDLNGQGDCSCPQTIPAGGYYECGFSATVSGNAGDVETNVVTASGTDDDGNPVSDDDDATVTIFDIPSAIEVIKTASPDQINEPGDDVTYSFTINNLSAVDTVTIDSLTDTIFGDLNGQGDCSCPQTIPAGGSYTCSVTAYVSGNAGDMHTNVVTASGTDDDGNPVSDDDDTTVTVTSCPDSDRDGVCDDEDGCPNDPNKTEPGDCGCGIPEGQCHDPWESSLPQHHDPGLSEFHVPGMSMLHNGVDSIFHDAFVSNIGAL